MSQRSRVERLEGSENRNLPSGNLPNRLIPCLGIHNAKRRAGRIQTAGWVHDNVFSEPRMITRPDYDGEHDRLPLAE